MAFITNDSEPTEGLQLNWRDITFDAELSDVVAKAQTPPGGVKPSHKRILYGITAQAPSNSLMAVMGPSGSGKTSLLHIVTGRRNASGGEITVNGAPLDKAALKKNSGFVTQNSVFLDALTVRETIVYTALLRLGRHLTWPEKRERAEQILAEVDLAKVADSQVGNEVVGGISGGERRRLTVALEIVHKPRILFLDEPTSGLDATSAQRLGEMLKNLSREGCTVLCTIHQPRESLLGVFDSLLLLAEGRTVYFGPINLSAGVDKADPTSGVLSYFSNAGFACPPLTNPADFLLDLLFDQGQPAAAAARPPLPAPGAAGGGAKKKEANRNDSCLPLELDGLWGTPARTAPVGAAGAPAQASSSNSSGADADFDLEAGQAPSAAARAQRASAGPKGASEMQLDLQKRQQFALEMHEKYLRSPVAELALLPPSRTPAPLAGTGQGSSPYPETWFTQFAVLWMRAFKYKLREPAAVMTQATMAIVLPALVGGIYWHISLRQSAVYDRLSAISFLVLLQGFMCYDQILLIAKERSVYQKDHSAGIYRTSSFYLSRICAELPFIVLFAFIAATIAYWMYGFQADASTYLTWCAIIVAVTDAGASLLNSLGALASSMETANLLATLIIVVLMLFDGFYINLNNIPEWCRWVHYLSFMHYGVSAASANQFRGLQFTCTLEEAPLGCVATGEEFLVRQGFNNVNVWAQVGCLVAYSAGNRFLSYMSLRFLYTGKSFRELLSS